VNRPQIPFGIVFLIVGLVAGYFVSTHPESLNPSWPMWMALLAVSMFAFAGLYMVAEGLGYPHLSAAAGKVIVVLMLAMANWAAFFTTDIQCVETLSFLGTPILRRFPSAVECGIELKVIITCIDALVVFIIAAFVWRNRARRRASARTTR